jgi:hypothetical protein
MIFAKVQSGIVIAISPTKVDNTWQPCGDMVQVGWLFSNNTFTPAVLPNQPVVPFGA